MVLGAVFLLEINYRLATQSRARPQDHVLLDSRGHVDAVAVAGRRGRARRRVRGVPAKHAPRGGSVERGGRAPAGAGGRAMTSVPALELDGRAQELRPHPHHSRGEPRHPRGRAPRHHRPQRRGQVHALQPDQRPLPRLGRPHQAEGRRHHRTGALRHQSTRPVAELSGHQYLSRPLRVRERTLRRAAGRSATATRSGAR